MDGFVDYFYPTVNKFFNKIEGNEICRREQHQAGNKRRQKNPVRGDAQQAYDKSKNNKNSKCRGRNNQGNLL